MSVCYIWIQTYICCWKLIKRKFKLIIKKQSAKYLNSQQFYFVVVVVVVVFVVVFVVVVVVEVVVVVVVGVEVSETSSLVCGSNSADKSASGSRTGSKIKAFIS